MSSWLCLNLQDPAHPTVLNFFKIYYSFLSYWFGMAHRQDVLSLNFLPLGFFLLSVSISSSGGKTILATEDKIPPHRFSYLSLFPRQRLKRRVCALDLDFIDALDLDIFLLYLDMARLVIPIFIIKWLCIYWITSYRDGLDSFASVRFFPMRFSCHFGLSYYFYFY